MEVKAMIEKQLKGKEKASHVFDLVLGVVFFVGFGCVAVFAPSELPLFARAGFVLGALFGAAVAAMEIGIIRKGTINLKTDSIAAAGAAWGFVIIITTLFMLNADKFPDPTRMLACMIVFEIAAGLLLLKAHIERSEVKTQEKLLEIEYQIAALTEKLDPPEADE
jgi:hypothetical protein